MSKINIASIIDYLNQELGCSLDSSYYKQIKEWEDWWRGYHEPFHHFKEVNGQKLLDRDMYTLKMAKKVCEDWAAILLNEKTELVLDDKASSEFLLGKDGSGGILGESDFWTRANELVEKAFYSGTGAVIVRLNDLALVDDLAVPDEKSRISLEYVSAQQIIPLTVRQGHVIDAAFASEVLYQGKTYVYLETHILKSGGYTITNQYFEEEHGSLKLRELPAGMLQSFDTGSDIPLFAVVQPNIVNNLEHHVGLGISVFANAIDNLKGVDLAFNNFCRDLKLGGKKVFLNQTLTQTDQSGNLITPDDVAQQLFLQMGDGDLDQEKLIHEFNPDLRTEANKEAVQAQLDYLSFKVGLGTKHYQFNAGSVVTATQYMGDKQELIQNASKHYIAVERFLQQLVRAVLWAGREILQQPVNPDAAVVVNFEDSYIIDKESERQRDQQEVRDGLMNKWEYRVKWYGEDEATAKAMLETQAQGLQFEE
nr:MAG TPA: portal protein [Caudoviricetes sp.]